MAFTADDLARVDAAIARGEASVQFADRSTTYRSVENLIKARDLIVAELAESATPRARQTLIVGRKGFDIGSFW